MESPVDAAREQLCGAAATAAPRAQAAGVLSGHVVVLIAEPGRSLAAVAGALHRAGCATHVAVHVVEARRSLTMLGPRALVIVDVASPPAWLDASLQVLSRQDAVVVSTSSSTSRRRTDLLDEGADAVVSNAEPGEVVAALSAVLRRAAIVAQEPPDDFVGVGDLQVHLSARVATVGGHTLRLTSLEFDLLAYFARRPGEPLSRERLLRDVWGYDIGGLDTVTVHVRRLRTKVEQDPSRPTRLQTVWGFGYRLAANAADADATTLGLPVAAV